MAKLVADIASYQPDTLAFMQALKAKGVQSVVIKLTEGSNPGSAYVNPKAQAQISTARQAGLKVHAYHYAKFYGTQDAEAEASWFVQNAQKLGITKDSVMVLDIEDKSNQKYPSDDCRAFFAKVKQAGYDKVALYSMRSWFTSGRLATDLAPLWVAEYGSTLNMDKTHVRAWQYTSDFKVAGIGIDMSYDYGLFTDDEASPSPAPEPSAPASTWVDDLGVRWYKETGTFTITDDAGIWLRWGATTQSAKIAALPQNSVVKYDAYCFSGGYVWIRQPRSGGQFAYLPTGREMNGKRQDYWGKFE